MVTHPGAADCEAIGVGFLAQPVNALSSLAYVGAAIWLAASARRRCGRLTPDVVTFGALVAADGIGSLLFHGPGDPVSHAVHDVALIGSLVAVAGSDIALLRDRDPSAAFTPIIALTAGAAALLVLAPSATNMLAAVAGGAALTFATLAGVRRRAGRRWRVGAAACLGAGVVLDLLGRTDARWCDPGTRLQPHAAWHVLTAATLALWGRAALVESVRPAPTAVPA